MSRERRYYTFQIAEILNLKVTTIRKYIREGKIKAYTIGKEYVVKESELNSFIDKLEKGER